MRIPMLSFSVAALALIAVSWAAPAESAATADEVQTLSYGGGLAWNLAAGHGGGALQISGETQRVVRQLRAGEPARFDLVAADGSRLPDGLYHWELWVASDAVAPASAADGLDNGRDAVATLGARRASTYHSGSFTIENGAVVDPTLREPERARVSDGFRHGGDEHE